MVVNVLCRVECCEDENDARMMAGCILGTSFAVVKFDTICSRVINNRDGKRVSMCSADEFGSFVEGCTPMFGANLSGIHPLEASDYAEGEFVYLVVVEATMKL